MKKRQVLELMNPDVVCATPEMTVAAAARLLGRRWVGGAPVVDESGRPIGVISQNDLVRHTAQRKTVAETGEFYTDDENYQDLAHVTADLSDTPVEKVMQKRVYTVGREASAAHAASIMRERRVHRLFVTERGRLVRVVEETC